MFRLTTMFKQAQPAFSTCIHLFDRIVKPVLIYGSDICGYRTSKSTSVYNEMKKDVFEKCHLHFCRFANRVNKRAPNLGIYGDNGYPIFISCAVQFLKYWHR